MKLSLRLQQINTMIPPGYEQIWDCCCDHGYLGAALLQRQAAPLIHFLDVVPRLMEEVHEKLLRFFPDQSRWQVHCCDLETLELPLSRGPQLLIIAGVGGEQSLRFVSALRQRYGQDCPDFLLCPANQAFTLRQGLIALNMGLQQEALVSENRRYYEILHITASAAASGPVSPAGQQIWLADDEASRACARDYLNRNLQHYRKMLHSCPQEAEAALAAYSHISIDTP